MSRSPANTTPIDSQHPYAQAANQLNRLVRLGHSFSGHERNCCYINVRGESFANASAVSGLDFPDDGRAVALADWDFDGDLDLWIANRTGPQLRWLRNDLVSGNHFVAVRLRGTRSNRDAVGAVAELHLAGVVAPLRKTIRAGEGYLAQGTKWLHFGIGDQSEIDRLEVRWPSGATDVIQEIEPNRFYLIVEENQRAERWSPPETVAATPDSDEVETAAENATHHRLTNACTLPPLLYRTLNDSASDSDRTSDATQTGGRLRLINLWAPWCRPCLVELAEWTDRQKDLRDANVDVLALLIDADPGADSKSSQTRTDTSARQLLERLQFPFAKGRAAADLLDILQLVNDTVYRDDHRPLPVPTSLLVDGAGRLVAIYKGPVPVERLLADASALATERDAASDSGLPFPGRWIGLPGPHPLDKLVIRLLESQLENEAIELAQRLPVAEGDDPRPTEVKISAVRAVAQSLQGKNRVSEAIQTWERLLQTAPENGAAHLELGALLARGGNLEPAVRHFRQAARYLDPPQAAAHLNLGQAYRQMKQADLARSEFETALKLEPQNAAAHSGLGLIYAGQSKFAAASASFAQAVAAEPQNIPHRMNLAAAHMQLGEPELALVHLDAALALDPSAAQARVFSAEAKAQLGRTDEAILDFQKIAQEQPEAANIWFRLGELSEQAGNLAKALGHFEQVDQLVPGDPYVHGKIAWILATAPEESLRDGGRAARLAEAAVAETRRQDAGLLDVLAAAYAEQGRHEEAVAVAGEALELLPAEGETSKAAAIRERRNDYEAGRPFRSK